MFGLLFSSYLIACGVVIGRIWTASGRHSVSLLCKAENCSLIGEPWL